MLSVTVNGMEHDAPRGERNLLSSSPTATAPALHSAFDVGSYVATAAEA